MPAAYLISESNVTDPDLMQEYSEKAGPSVAAHDGELIAASTERRPYGRHVEAAQARGHPLPEHGKGEGLVQLARVSGGAAAAQRRRQQQRRPSSRPSSDALARR